MYISPYTGGRDGGGYSMPNHVYTRAADGSEYKAPDYTEEQARVVVGCVGELKRMIVDGILPIDDRDFEMPL